MNVVYTTFIDETLASAFRWNSWLVSLPNPFFCFPKAHAIPLDDNRALSACCLQYFLGFRILRSFAFRRIE